MNLSFPKWLRTLGAVAVLGFGLSACGSDDDEVAVATPAPSTIVDVAQKNPDFSILVEAVVAAGLVDTLKGPGPFTVFAPTNDAFAALLTELGVTKDQLLADKALLTQVLTYHVLAGKVEAAQVAGVLGKAIATVEGGIFKVDNLPAGLTITDERNRTSKITATDVQASNGVIHVIDKVILPGDKTVVDIALADPQFSTLVAALSAANLVDALKADGPFTVFAPTNAAFDALAAKLGLSSTADLLTNPLLADILKYHVVPSRVLKAEVPVGAAVASLQGATFTVNSSLKIVDQATVTDDSSIVLTDVLARNGVVHVIDQVILPVEP